MHHNTCRASRELTALCLYFCLAWERYMHYTLFCLQTMISPTKARLNGWRDVLWNFHDILFSAALIIPLSLLIGILLPRTIDSSGSTIARELIAVASLSQLLIQMINRTFIWF
jgi:hypothetical protein